MIKFKKVDAKQIIADDKKNKRRAEKKAKASRERNKTIKTAWTEAWFETTEMKWTMRGGHFITWKDPDTEEIIRKKHFKDLDRLKAFRKELTRKIKVNGNSIKEYFIASIEEQLSQEVENERVIFGRSLSVKRAVHYFKKRKIEKARLKAELKYPEYKRERENDYSRYFS